MLTVVKYHSLQLRCHFVLFQSFKQFNIKAAKSHHCTLQKKVDQLLAKGAIELSTGGAGFYSNVFIVPKCSGGL